MQKWCLTVVELRRRIFLNYEAKFSSIGNLVLINVTLVAITFFTSNI